MISVTDIAAEKLSKAQEGQDMTGKMLRIGVFSAGCSGGYQYALGFDARNDTDSVFESNGFIVSTFLPSLISFDVINFRLVKLVFLETNSSFISFSI